MKLYIDDRVISIIYDNTDEKKIFNEYFTWDDMSQAFSRGGFDPKKINHACFLRKNKEYNFLYSGFLYEVALLCKKHKFKITEFKDKRTKFPFQKKKHSESKLKKHFPFDYNEHQIEALEKILSVNTGIVKAPTSAGKGDIIFSFIKETRLPTLILVNKIGLASQLGKRAEEAGILSVGIWHSKEKTEGDVMFATIGSVGSIPALDRYKVLIIDEVHRASSNQFQEFLKNSSYPIRIGFSATPDKGDKYIYSTIRQFMGSIIYEVSAKKLMDNEVIAKPQIIFVPVDCKPTENWPEAYEEAIIKNKERNNKIVTIVEKFNIPTLILIKDVKHKQGEIIKEALEEDLDKNVMYIHGNSGADREKAIEMLENNEIDVLIATNILNEGISIKNIHLLINASGGKSKVENLQKLGRGVRTTKDKKSVVVIDFFDEGNKFTERHSILRKKLYQKEGYTDIIENDITLL